MEIISIHGLVQNDWFILFSSLASILSFAFIIGYFTFPNLKVEKVEKVEWNTDTKSLFKFS